MKSVFKKCLTALVAICVMVSMFTVGASAAGTSLAFSKNSVNVGDTITVTVRFSASSEMYAIQAQVHYDTSILQFVSADSGEGSGGIVNLASDANGTSASENIVFKAVGAGKTTISVKEAGYTDGGPIAALSGCSASVTVTDKSATKSSNANLKSIVLSAGTLTPKFSKDVTTYSVTIPNNVKEVLVTANVEDSSAKWDVEGSKTMKDGANKRVVVVTASDGTVKRYIINITRLAADGTTSETQEPDTENPTITEKVSVTADGKDFYISDQINTENIPEGYALDVYTYNNTEVACIKKGDTVLFYLTDAEGQNGGYYRLGADGVFTKFVLVTMKSTAFEILKPDTVPNGYTAIAYNIDDVEITAFKSSNPELTEFVLIYAIGPSGKVGFYRYDTTEGTMQRVVDETLSFEKEEEANTSIIDNIMGMDSTTKIIAGTIIGIIVLLIAAIIVLIVKIATSGREEDDEDAEETEDDELAEFDFVSISDRDIEE